MYSANFSVTISHFSLFGLDYTILIRIITLNGFMTILLLVTPTGIGTSLIIKRYEANILSFLSWKHNVFKRDLPVTKLWRIYVRYNEPKLLNEID